MTDTVYINKQTMYFCPFWQMFYPNFHWFEYLTFLILFSLWMTCHLRIYKVNISSSHCKCPVLPTATRIRTFCIVLICKHQHACNIQSVHADMESELMPIMQPKLISIRNPKSKTVLIFYSQKTINTLVKSQYISIHLVSFSRVKWQWITSILLLQNITIA